MTDQTAITMLCSILCIYRRRDTRQTTKIFLKIIQSPSKFDSTDSLSLHIAIVIERVTVESVVRKNNRFTYRLSGNELQPG